MKKIKLVLVFLFCYTLAVFSQDPIFSQPSMGNVNLNPALAGNDSIARLGFIVRDQWPNLSGRYLTTSVNFYQYIPKLNAYAGINYINDNQADGTIITDKISIFYSQNINIKKVLFRPSLEINFAQIKIDVSKLTFGSQVNPQFGYFSNNNLNQTVYSTQYLDFNIGTITYYKNLTVGVSVHHVTQPDIGIMSPSKISARFGLQLSYAINLKKISISPFVIYTSQQNFTMLLGGVNLLFFNHINFALSYRNTDALITNIGYQTKLFKINYSYDYTISQLSNISTGGTHELGLSFRFWKVKPKKRLILSTNIFS